MQQRSVSMALNRAMEAKPGGTRGNSKRCPACGSRVAQALGSCEICGHVFGDTKAIPKAEIQAAVERERQRQAAPSAARPAGTNRPRLVKPAAGAPERRAIPWGVIGVVTAIIGVIAGGAYLLSSLPQVATEVAPKVTVFVDAGIGSGTATPAGAQANIAILVTPDLGPAATPTLFYPTRTPLPPLVYKIVRGDTCGGIAQRFGMSLPAFQRYNGLNDDTCTSIRIGDTLQIPPPTPTPGPTETLSPDYTPPPPPTNAPFGDFDYEVKAGDSCSTIAQQFQITVDALIGQNTDLNQQCLIRAGQKLKIARSALAPTIPATAYVLQASTPRAGFVAPVVLSPVDNAQIDGETLTLEWITVGTLKANEWYVVQIQPSGAITVPVFETKGTSIRLTEELLGNQPERTYVWWVQVRQKLDSMSDGTPVYNSLSANSQVRQFVWRRPVPTTVANPVTSQP
jgi:LysM repeat protein